MWRRLAGLIVCSASIWFLIVPGVRVVIGLCDAGARSAKLPDIAWSLHRSLTPRHEAWSKRWLASERGAQLSVDDISGTEWPLFGCCFYLWATESLHDQHLASGHADPLGYSREAVNVATNLVLDPRSAGWVRKHWGERYLSHQNVFYRMLVMSAIISQHRLTGETTHLALLREQVEGLAAELDAAPSGLLDDYPGQCFPDDVVVALAAIKRADPILGTDHSAFLQRALSSFTGANVLALGLPPYAATATTGQPHDASRGCGNSYLGMQSPTVWPEQARKWYASYVANFWQQDWLAAGFREFPRGAGHEWYFDVDAGPVVHGLGFAASAFGLAAARTHADYERVYPLTAMTLAFSVPLAEGTLLFPRALSNAADAPLLGESAVLYCLTRMPFENNVATAAKVWKLPFVVWFILLVELGLGWLLLHAGWRLLRSAVKAG